MKIRSGSPPLFSVIEKIFRKDVSIHDTMRIGRVCMNNFHYILFPSEPTTVLNNIISSQLTNSICPAFCCTFIVVDCYHKDQAQYPHRHPCHCMGVINEKPVVFFLQLYGPVFLGYETTSHSICIHT